MAVLVPSRLHTAREQGEKVWESGRIGMEEWCVCFAGEDGC